VSCWFRSNQVDAVIHCAVSGRNDPFSNEPTYLTESLLMFRNLWNCRNRYSQFINLGSAYEYDLSRNNLNVKEEDILDHLPTTSYGLAKNIIARIIKNTNNFFNLRLFGVFHETESSQRFFKKVIEQEIVTIQNDVLFDYIYLPDIIPMIECILRGNSQHRDINMVYPHKYRLSDFARKLCESVDIDYRKVIIVGNNDCNLTGDSLKLASYNFPLIGIDQGIENYK
jgi:dTDP-4-dehydrorhamnose reductase